MSETLSLRTIAEGIEKPEQITALQDLGCELGQGFHFAKPLDTDDMNSFLLEANLNREPGWMTRQIEQEKIKNQSLEVTIS